nr:dienelactone hydrolase family protein [Glaciihabitans sp. dw_435]
MAEVLLFHHAQGLTTGVRDFARALEAAGHVVHLPDLYDGNVFGTLDEGMVYARGVGFDVLLEKGRLEADGLPDALAYVGFSLGVMPAQLLAQTRPGATAAIFLHGCLPVAEFGDAWPDGVPVQIHGMDADEWFVDGGDLEAAEEILLSASDAELFLYPGSDHLFTDNSLPAFDADASALALERVLGLLGRV